MLSKIVSANKGTKSNRINCRRNHAIKIKTRTTKNKKTKRTPLSRWSLFHTLTVSRIVCYQLGASTIYAVVPLSTASDCFRPCRLSQPHRSPTHDLRCQQCASYKPSSCVCWDFCAPQF